MLRSVEDIFKIPDLKKKVLFTLGILAVFRLGTALPLPGVNTDALKAFFAQQSGTIFGFLDMFSGGAMGRLSIFALGIMPYINASIIISLLQTAVPYLEKLAKEGELGRRKITQFTRYATVFIGLVQSFGFTLWLRTMKAPDGSSIIYQAGTGFQFLMMLTLVVGTMLCVWLGEQITENGVGNGISLIIFIGIIARFPASIKNVFNLVRTNELSLFGGFFFMLMALLITAFVVLVEQAYRKIPVQYARRVVGRKVYGGQQAFLPLKVDQSGVIAVIFAVAVMTFPLTFAQFFPNQPVFQKISEWINRGSPLYNILYSMLIIFFCFFYTAITFNPQDIAENLKRWGGYVPGIRPGEPTADYLNRVLTRITVGGAVFIVLIAVMPQYLKSLGAPFWFGGTGLLIAVGVALDTMGQIE
ncbi:MAG TPA: preprotein translocase subunit SecY, partial [bacterium]|nr:preprotein translocase subunit SecY [bacterium]